MYLIYKHTSKTTGKSYIGKTCYTINPNKRWKNGLGYSKQTQPAFFNAIQKYGWDNFEHTILENYIEDFIKACEREKYWIEYYHTWIYDPLCNGYNISQGGEGTPGHKLSEQTKQKIREARLSQANLSLNHNKGKKFYNNGIVCGLFFEGTQPEGWILGRLLSIKTKTIMSQKAVLNNKKRTGKLKKVVIIKDGQLKCIGAINLDKYIADGWCLYIKGTGGKIQHAK